MPDYFKLTEKEKQKVKAIIKNILKKCPKIKTAIIFGSFVNRKYFHDIDIAIIGKLSVDEILDIETKLSRATGFEIEIRRFDELYLTFQFHVISGETLFSKNKEEFATLKSNTIRNYLDFQPFKELNDKWLLGLK